MIIGRDACMHGLRLSELLFFRLHIASQTQRNPYSYNYNLISACLTLMYALPVEF